MNVNVSPPSGSALKKNTATVGGVAFGTLAAAKAAAQVGDTIYVGPGTYNERDLLKVGVNWWFAPGAVVSFVDGATGTGYGIFDDRSSGAVDCIIGGHGTFHFQSTAFNATSRGTVTITNANTSIALHAKRVSTATDDANSFRGALFLLNATQVVFQIEEIIDTDYDGSLALGGNAAGIYWEKGFTVGYVKHCKVGGNCLWSATPDGTAQNIYLTAELLHSRSTNTVYHAPNALASLVKTWVRAQEILNDASNAVGVYSAGKFYLVAEKISTAAATNTISFNATFTGEAWITAQKVTAGFRCLSMLAGTAYINIGHWEDGGAASEMIAIGAAVTLCVLNGGWMKSVSAPGIIYSGANLRVIGMTIDTSATDTANNAPIRVSGAGCRVNNCVLIAGTVNGISIDAAAAQTVRVFGTSFANKAKSVNVTVQGTLTVDANCV